MLQEAREAGLFHPNCLHRLEYVSISEIPKSLWPKVKDKIGVPGAFGDNKTATKPDLQTNAERKKHVKQVEAAAEEKAKEEPRTSIVGKLGDWRELGLHPGIEIEPDIAEQLVSVEEAEERLKKGEMVEDPLGRKIGFSLHADKHINKKGRKKQEVNIRLKSINRAQGTCKNPHEIWIDERTKREKYIRFVVDENGKAVINVVTEEENRAFSWHSNCHSLDHYRNGRLIYLRS